MILLKFQYKYVNIIECNKSSKFISLAFGSSHHDHHLGVHSAGGQSLFLGPLGLGLRPVPKIGLCWDQSHGTGPKNRVFLGPVPHFIPYYWDHYLRVGPRLGPNLETWDRGFYAWD